MQCFTNHATWSGHKQISSHRLPKKTHKPTFYNRNSDSSAFLHRHDSLAIRQCFHRQAVCKSPSYRIICVCLWIKWLKFPIAHQNATTCDDGKAFRSFNGSIYQLHLLVERNAAAGAMLENFRTTLVGQSSCARHWTIKNQPSTTVECERTAAARRCSLRQWALSSTKSRRLCSDCSLGQGMSRVRRRNRLTTRNRKYKIVISINYP